LVVSVSVAAGVEVAKVPLAPVAGAVKVTLTPLVGVPPVVTSACNGANAVPTATLCGDVPPVVVMVTNLAGGVLELLPPQPVRKVTVEKISAEIANAGMLQ
jgi:hypothetical protein